MCELQVYSALHARAAAEETLRKNRSRNGTGGHNLIVTGPTGAGKTFVLSAFGHAACMPGMSVRSFRTSRLLTDLAIGRGDGSYEGNQSVINNYINPLIGKTKLSEINTHFLERYYQRLLTTPAVPNPMTGKQDREYVGPSTIRDAHKILRSCFSQAVKWELMDKNPAAQATVPRYKSARREIWTADMLAFAMEVCSDVRLVLAWNAESSYEENRVKGFDKSNRSFEEVLDFMKGKADI